MAEVESIAVAANLPADVTHLHKNVDLPTSSANETTDSNDTQHVATEPSVETGTSPTQERSSNSHPHDSEYDTATDLEGAEDYEDEEDSATEDEDYDESDEEHEKQQEGDEESSNAEKADGDTPKKVDEDRRNPQYIPKRGTFYEHDDREDEVAADAKGTAKVSPVPASQPTKTRKWQPTPGSDRWSHDRFDASEQAPKSAAELVTAYGYDIRNEEAAPRARRRRRYAKGPTRYQRNWEDENAYQRNTNKERRPPRPSDFPALDERAPKGRRSVNSRLNRSNRNEDQENQSETVSLESDRPSEGWSNTGHKAHNKFGGGGGNDRRLNANSGRHQTPMQFKSKQRRNQAEHNNRNNSEHFERQGQGQGQKQQQHNNAVTEPHKYSNNMQQTQSKPANFANENNYSNNSSNNVLLDQVYRVQTPTTTTQQQQQQQMLRQPQMQQKTAITGSTSNLQQRLQQVQNRNDPSHVGSVQMHSLAQQNQMQVNQQQVAPPAGMLLQQQQQQQPPPSSQQQLAQEQQRGPPKRYSSIRRTQHDAHLSEHQLQQLQQQQQQQAMLLPPEQQHMLAQANLMQHLYHQEKLQAQMQALQVSQPPPAAAVVSKPNAYSTVPGAPPATAQGYAPNTAAGTNVPTAAFYVAAAPPPEATPYAPQAAPNTNYLPPAPYGPAPAAAGPPAGAFTAPPSVAVSAAAAAVVAGQPTSSANPNFTNYQNYNTVGGTTYFVPPPQPSARQPVLPQRRPTNAIPILPPDSSERAKQQQLRSGSEAKDDMNATAVGSAENIDHIIDNMFVQRPVFQPPRKSSSPPPAEQQGDVPAPLASSQTDDVMINAEKQPDLNVNVEQQENIIEKPVPEQ